MREFLTTLILSLSSFIFSFSACLSDFASCNSSSKSLMFFNSVFNVSLKAVASSLDKLAFVSLYCCFCSL